MYVPSCSAADSLRILRVDDVTILGATHAGGMRSLLTPAIVQGTTRDPRGPWPPGKGSRRYRVAECNVSASASFYADTSGAAHALLTVWSAAARGLLDQT